MITGSGRALLGLPSRAHLRFTAGLMLLVAIWFAVVFIGADWVTAHRSTRVRVHLDAELGLPLLPGFLVAYMSIYALFLAVPFVLRTRREVTSLAIAQFVTVLLAGVGFVLIPARLAYAPPGELGAWTALYRLADWMNLDHDLVPSLHVALSIVCIESFARCAGRRGVLVLRGWGALIAVSTLLTHQHHLLDVVTGYGLALVVSMRGDWAPRSAPAAG